MSSWVSIRAKNETRQTFKNTNNTTTMTTHFNRRFGNTRRIHGHNGPENALAEQRRHENGPERRGRGHEDGQRHVALGNVRAQVAGLSAIDAANQYHAGNERSLQPKGLAEAVRQCRHHGVAEGKLHENGDGFLRDLHEIVRRQRNAHAEHEGGQSGGKVLGGEPGKGLGRFERNGGEENRPDGEQIGGGVGGRFVGVKEFLAQRLFFAGVVGFGLTNI